MGPAFEVGGTLLRPLVTRKETNGRFSIYFVESTSLYREKGFNKLVQFAQTHHALQTAEGIVKVIVNSEEKKVVVGETIFISPEEQFSIVSGTVYSMFYFLANGGGLGEVLQRLGQEYKFAVPPTKEQDTRV